MTRVIDNLLQNAAKFTAAGSVTLSCKKDDSKRRLRIRVADTGIGIPPEAQSRVFERFYRVDKARSRQSGGTGLGLAIAKWIVDRHGGWFEVVSREGVGTRISFLLPTAPASAEEEAV